MTSYTRYSSGRRYQIGTLATLGIFGVLVTASAPASAKEHATRNVVLVTLDGVRPQEFFTGMDHHGI